MKVGDVVKLKSGGPWMTGTKAEAGYSLHCVWFDGTDKKDGTFPPDSLMPVNG